MNRVKDYLQFAIRFVGLGYIVLWPLTAHDVGITALEAQVVCGGGFFGAPGMNCAASHSIQLSPGLHLLGLVAVICLVAQLLLVV